MERKLNKRYVYVEFDIVVDGDDEQDIGVFFNIFIGFGDDGKVRLRQYLPLANVLLGAKHQHPWKPSFLRTSCC